MKKTPLIILFLLAIVAAFPVAAQNSADYSVNVHVSSSRWVLGQSTIGPMLYQMLNVTIDGKKYELKGFIPAGNGLTAVVLATGDYKAKLVKDEHRDAYEFAQAYEFQFPDKKTKKFFVVGEME
jgi:hypothetical protein